MSETSVQSSNHFVPEPLRRLWAKLWPDSERRRRFRLYFRKAVAIWLNNEKTTIWLHCDQPSIYLGTPVCLFRPVAFKGWALATRGSVTVSLSCDGNFVGDAAFGIPRPDVVALTSHLRQAIRCGYEYILEPEEVPAGLHTLTLTARGRDGTTVSNCCTIDVIHRSVTFDQWRRQTTATPGVLAWMRRQESFLSWRPEITLFLTLADDTDWLLVQDTIRSLQAQSYPSWRLGIACDKPAYERLGDRLAEWVEEDARITVRVEPFAAAGDIALHPLEQATGQLVGLIDAGDMLAPHCLFEFVYHFNRYPGHYVAYSDQDSVFSNLVHADPLLKPGGPDNLAAHESLLGRLWLMRCELAVTMGGLPANMDAAAEQQFLSKAAQNREHMGHIQSVLYSKRHSGQGVLEPESAPPDGATKLDDEPIVLRPAPTPMLDANQIRRILVVRLDHLGDVLLTLPALGRLRELFPAARITALVGSWCKSLVLGHPGVDEVLTYDLFQANSETPPRNLSDVEKQQIAERLTPYRFDLAIDFRREPESRDILRWSGARFTAGFAHGEAFAWLSVVLPTELNVKCQRPRRHMTQEMLQLVEMIGIGSREDLYPRVRVSEQDQARAEEVLRTLLPTSKQLLVAIHPGSGRPIKCWPAEHFARLADRLCAELGAFVVFFGSGSEVSLVQGILGQMRLGQQAISVAGQLSIGELLAAFGQFDLYIGNDSGPTHLAASQGLPTLCICSGTIDAVQWAPLGPAALTIQRRMLCSPCYLRHPDECPYGVACLKELPVEDVFEAAIRVLLPKWSRAPVGSEMQTPSTVGHSTVGERGVSTPRLSTTVSASTSPGR